MYEYRAQVIKVVDGDTVWLDVDLGMDLHVRTSVRLYGIDAPETNTVEGKAAREYLTTRLPVGTEVALRTIKDKREKYGRYLATIMREDENMNATMVSTGHARFYDGGKR